MPISCSLVIFLFLFFVIFVANHPVVATEPSSPSDDGSSQSDKVNDELSTSSGTTTTSKTTNITVIGLGGMGRAIASCLASKSDIQVHAWNRGMENRQLLANTTPSVIIHDDISSAIKASSSIVIMVVVADRGLKTATSLIESVTPTTLWKDKTIVQYTTHEPLSIQKQTDLLQSFGATSVIGGAIVAVPHMVCSNHGTYLLSSDNDDHLSSSPVLPILKHLGPTTIFEGDDVGYASLAYFGIIQSLQFGLSGHELTLLLMEKYIKNNENNKEDEENGFTSTTTTTTTNTSSSSLFIEIYTKIIQQNVPMYFQRFTGLATKAVMTKDYKALSKSFLPADAYLEILEMHLEFIDKMFGGGVVSYEDTYLHTYLQVFRKIKSPETVGPTVVVEYYKKNNHNDDEEETKDTTDNTSKKDEL